MLGLAVAKTYSGPANCCQLAYFTSKARKRWRFGRMVDDGEQRGEQIRRGIGKRRGTRGAGGALESQLAQMRQLKSASARMARRARRLSHAGRTLATDAMRATPLARGLDPEFAPLQG